MREMKDSGIEWVGTIPKEWDVKANKYVMTKIKVIKPLYQGEDILSLTMNGVIVRDLDAGGKMPTSFNGYQTLYPGNLLMCLFDYDVTPRCIGLIKNSGVTSPAYSQFVMKDGYSAEYYYYYYLMVDHTKALLHRAKNLRHSFTEDQLGAISVPVPPLVQQKQIVSILDTKCAEIDALTADIQSEIETLEAYKRSVITEAVTKGLDKNVPMKDSGIKWCPQIPEHWENTNPKALFSQRYDRATIGERQLTASQDYGIVYQDEYMEMTGNRVVTVLKDFSILKHVEPGDFVISMRSFQGGLEYSEVRGCISSAYVMLIPNKKLVYPPFYRWFFKSSKYINAIQSTSNLVRDGQAMRYANFVQVPLFIIPLDEQKKISEYLDEKVKDIDLILKDKREQLEVLADYKKSVIYEYVTGKKEVVSE